MENVLDSVVIGAGQAGLAAAYYLKEKKITYLVLEGSNQTCGSWPEYYDSLTLFSPARFASLPGLPFPGNPDHYPSRKEVVDYLNQYARHFNLNIHTQQKVNKIRKLNSLFEVQTEKGDIFYSKTIVSASGAFSNPFIPDLPGRNSFRGKILHSKDYKNETPYKKRIIVVGGGNSAVQIGFELAKHAHVTLAVRRPISFTPQVLLGKDIHYWLQFTGLDRLSIGKSLAIHVSVLDTGIYKQALMNNQPDQKDMITSFTENGVIWSDGTEEEVDTVLFATGYRPNLGYLKSIEDALDHKGTPVHSKGVSIVPGLFFMGLSGQRTFASAAIRGVGADAKFIVNKIKEELGENDDHRTNSH